MAEKLYAKMENCDAITRTYHHEKTLCWVQSIPGEFSQVSYRCLDNVRGCQRSRTQHQYVDAQTRG